ncbi:MAG: hypothetical protein ABFR82_06055 [Nitrospirota bacterium]
MEDVTLHGIADIDITGPNPLMNGIYSGAIGGFACAVLSMMLTFLGVGLTYMGMESRYTIAETMLLSFLETLLLGVLIGVSLAYLRERKNSEAVEIWSMLGGLIGVFTGVLIGLLSKIIVITVNEGVYSIAVIFRSAREWGLQALFVTVAVIFVKRHTFPSYEEGLISSPLSGKQKNILGVLLFLILLMTGLHIKGLYQYRENPPFFEGLFLKYEFMNSAGESFNYYEIESYENNRFHMIEKDAPVFSEKDKKEYTLNRWGRVIKKKRGRFSEGFSSIWIPVNKMEIGDNFDNGYTVVRRDKWRQWEVLVVKDSLFGGERYFDINTGFWVGLSVTTGMGGATFVLVDTNADIPVKK